MRPQSTLVAVFLACAAGRALAQVPVVTTLDSAGDVGASADVALRADGRGFVAYTDDTNGALKAASCADIACTSAALVTVDTGGPFRAVSTAIGAGGRPLIAYEHAASASVRVAVCSDATCTSATVATIGDALARGTDIAVGADALPVVAYVGPGAGTLTVAHCSDALCAARSVTAYPDAEGPGFQPALGRDGTGRIFFASVHGRSIRLGRCANAACTAATFARLAGSSMPPITVDYFHPALSVGSDGLPVIAYVYRSSFQPVPLVAVQMSRCDSAACTSLTLVSNVVLEHFLPGIGMAPGDRPVVSHSGLVVPFLDAIQVTRCFALNCFTSTTVLIDEIGASADHSMAVAPLGAALLCYQSAAGADLKVAWLDTPLEISIGDVVVTEGDSGATEALLPVSLSGADSGTVDFATASGTATSGVDFLPASGTLTFTPGTATRFVTVSVVGDLAPEGDETFRVLLSNAHGAIVVDAEGVGTIRDDDVRLSVTDESVVEGDTGWTALLFTVGLDQPATGPVLVDFATEGLSATSGVDFLAAAGTLSFAPGETARAATVPVVGDLDLEPDETFRVLLSNAQGAVVLDGEGVGTILDDDEPPAHAPDFAELRHGASYEADLAADPAADVDDFALLQSPYASYEVLVDDLSGDVVPLTVERRTAAGPPAQTGAPVGTGSAVSLRWRVAGTTSVSDELVRVAGACAAACGADDVYRVRAYETTLLGTRFNNTGGQFTVLLLQNRSDAPVSLAVHFWGPDGTLLATHVPAAPLAPHAVLVLSTVVILPGSSGSLTVAHDAPYGGLVGKAVALEPTTGFSLDTPVAPRPR